MATARPVVVSRAGGAEEIAEAGALFHSPGNVGELAQAIAQLAGDASLRASLGTAGRRAALRLFGKQRLSDALVPLYESLATQ
jgi:glycosyltransferase involved in cell wall biosynthesis